MRGSIQRILWLAAVLALVVVFGACRSRNESSEPAATEAGRETGEVGEPADSPSETQLPAETVSEPSEPAMGPSSAPVGEEETSSPPSVRAPSPPPASAPATAAAEPVESTQPGEPPPPLPPPEPQIIEVTLPEGTVLELELLTALDTSVNRVGDEIQARTLSPVYLKGDPVLPQGTYVEGRVTEVKASGRVKGRSQLGFTFDRLSTRSGVKTIKSSYVEKEAASGKKKDATIIGGGAGVGALVGGIIGGKKGAAIGAAIGGAGGTSIVLATKGEEIRLPVGTEVNVRLDEPVVIRIN